MSSGTLLVESALGMIGVHSVVSPADSSSIEKGRVALNSMIQSWTSRGIDLNITPLNSVGDDLNEPPDSTNAIIYNLAVHLAPYFDNGEVIVSDDLRLNARNEFHLIKTLYHTITIPKKKVSSTLPMGQGNSKEVRSTTFFGEDNQERKLDA